MITLKEFIKLIPEYQDYKILYLNNIINQDICIKDSSYTDTDDNDFMKKYGEWYVESVEAATHKILYVYLYEGRIK